MVPDIHKSIQKGLQFMASLIGNDAVIAYFQDFGSDVRKVVAPVDIGNHLDKQARELAGDRIKSLLQET